MQYKGFELENYEFIEYILTQLKIIVLTKREINWINYIANDLDRSSHDNDKKYEQNQSHIEIHISRIYSKLLDR